MKHKANQNLPLTPNTQKGKTKGDAIITQRMVSKLHMEVNN